MGLGAAVPHAVAGESLVYEATATTNVTVEGIAAQESTMVTSVLGGETTITVRRQGRTGSKAALVGILSAKRHSAQSLTTSTTGPRFPNKSPRNQIKKSFPN